MEAVKPGTRYVRLHLSEDALLDELVESGHLLRLHGSNMNHIWERAGAPKALPLMYPMELDISSAGTGLSESIQEPGGPWISETNELVWNNLDSAESVFTINSESVKAVVGYVSGRTYTLGNLSIVVDSTEFRWAAIVMASLDGKPVEKASDLLLIAAGRVENTNMGWNEDHTTVGSEWGVSPTRAEGIPAWLYMENAERFEVYALDASGSRSEEIRVKKAKNQQSFVIGAQYKTLWYLLKRDE
jgi:hypothetical protein